MLSCRVVRGVPSALSHTRSLPRRCTRLPAARYLQLDLAARGGPRSAFVRYRRSSPKGPPLVATAAYAAVARSASCAILQAMSGERASIGAGALPGNGCLGSAVRCCGSFTAFGRSVLTRMHAQMSFKGVALVRNGEREFFKACINLGGHDTQLGRFRNAEEAARAYDDAVRKAGRRAVNFPRPGTNEVQAVKGEAEDVTLQCAAGKRPPPRSGPLPPDPGYKGVSVNAAARTAAVFEANFTLQCVHSFLGTFCTAEEAARAYDDAVRKAGRRVVNFPRPGTDEVQAVKGEIEEVTLLRAAGERLPPRSGPLPPDPGYKGVSIHCNARTAAVFKADCTVGGALTYLGHFCDAEEAAHAYDDAIRKADRRVVNFPRPGTDEVQAVKGEMENVTLLRAAGERLPPRSGPLPPDPCYKGVTVDASAQTTAVFKADCTVGGAVTYYLGNFCNAEEAARAYDDAVRKAGRRVVNFPRPGTDEVQAVKGEKEEMTLQRAAGKLLPPRSGPLPPDPGYKGVRVDAAARTAAVFKADFRLGGRTKSFGHFCNAEEAARAYDDAVRNEGRRVVNFPRPATNEVQAVKGEADKITLMRHAAEESAGGAGAAGGITSHGMAAPSTKRRAAAPPSSQPSNKRAAAAVETQVPAAVKPESPAAPPPATYTRRPPHRIELAAWPPPADEKVGTVAQAAVKPESPAAPPPARYTRRPPHRIDTASWPPPADEKPGADACAAGVKKEAPAGSASVKPESPAAPAIPAPGWPLPAISAVKMEDTEGQRLC